MKAGILLSGALLMAGCSQSKDEVVNAEAPNAAMPADAAIEAGATDNPAASLKSEVSGNISQFTTNDLKACRIVEKNEGEGGYFRYRCPGARGYNYELVESDLRQSLVILAPGGRRDNVELSAFVGGGGFSTIGKTFEWRGPAGRPPRTLTVRYNVNEKPDPKAPPTSYLIVIDLAAAACAMRAIGPGPQQSEQARAFADLPKLPECDSG